MAHAVARRSMPARLRSLLTMGLALMCTGVSILWIVTGWMSLRVHWDRSEVLDDGSTGARRSVYLAEMGCIGFIDVREAAPAIGTRLWCEVISGQRYGPRPRWMWWGSHTWITGYSVVRIPLWVAAVATGGCVAALRFVGTDGGAQNTCTRCGYDLAGNALGCCPECGEGAQATLGR
jgi:hypothetical protein